MKKILLVEDNEMNRDMLSRRLIRKGYEVVMAINGMQAVEMTSSESPDIILMDINLPDIDGWEATRRIRQHESSHSIPIIAVTAHAMQADQQHAFDVGCNDYEPKPINLSKLLEKIEALIKMQ